MRTQRFEAFVVEQIQRRRTEAIADVQTFAEAGVAGWSYGEQGLRVTFANGAQIYLALPGAYPPGGDDPASEEKIVTGPAPAEAPLPALEIVDGRLSVGDFEAWLVAVLANAGSDEIASVAPSSSGRLRHLESHKRGVVVRFHNGGAASVMFVHTLAAGVRAQPHELGEGRPNPQSNQYRVLERI